MDTKIDESAEARFPNEPETKVAALLCNRYLHNCSVQAGMHTYVCVFFFDLLYQYLCVLTNEIFLVSTLGNLIFHLTLANIWLRRYLFSKLSRKMSLLDYLLFFDPRNNKRVLLISRMFEFAYSLSNGDQYLSSLIFPRCRCTNHSREYEIFISNAIRHIFCNFQLNEVYCSDVIKLTRTRFCVFSINCYN